MNIISLFSGCGGLDLGFHRAGFNILWANEYDKDIWATFEHNHPNTVLDRRSIIDIPSSDIPDCDGIIGGPPCQSWSEAGAHRGINDARGKLFYEFIRILEDKRPRFFLAENVSGILAPAHRFALVNILDAFERAGYRVTLKLLNARDYNVPQDRERVIVVGYRHDVKKVCTFPEPVLPYRTLRDAIWDLQDTAMPAIDSKPNPDCQIANHEYQTGGFSTMYMSRNRVRSWDEPSFTIQAGGRHAPLHPQANKMIQVGKDKRIFDPESPMPYRRLSVRECARIQTFPDDFKYLYKNILTGYKMIGNAVPPNFAYHLAHKIHDDLTNVSDIDYQSHSIPQQLKIEVYDCSIFSTV